MKAALRDASPLLGAFIVAGCLLMFSPPASFQAASTLALGRTMVETHHGLQAGWLGALATFLIWTSGGYPVLTAFDMLFFAFALSQVDARCRARGLGIGARVFAMTILLAMSLGVARVGGGMADVAFAALLLRLLDNERPSWRVLALVTVLWCNVSPVGLLAPIFALCARVRPSLVLAVVALAVLATPAGIGLPLHALAELHLDGMSTWQPMQVSSSAFLYGFVPTVILAAIFGLWRAGKRHVTVAVCALLLAQLNGIYLGIAGAALAPLVAEAFERMLAEYARPVKPEGEASLGAGASLEGGTICAVMVIACVVGGISWIRGTTVTDGARGPASAIAYLAQDGKPHRLFCLRAEWCALARFRDAASIQVVPTEREERAAPDLLALERVKPGWQKTLDQRRVDAMLTTPYGMGSLLSLLPNWRRVASYDGVWVFERSP